MHRIGYFVDKDLCCTCQARHDLGSFEIIIMFIIMFIITITITTCC